MSERSAPASWASRNCNQTDTPLPSLFTMALAALLVEKVIDLIDHLIMEYAQVVLELRDGPNETANSRWCVDFLNIYPDFSDLPIAELHSRCQRNPDLVNATSIFNYAIDMVA